MVYFGNLSVAEATNHQMTGRVVKIELESMWKETLEN
jgi:hypothetical protein